MTLEQRCDLWFFLLGSVLKLRAEWRHLPFAHRVPALKLLAPLEFLSRHWQDPFVLHLL